MGATLLGSTMVYIDIAFFVILALFLLLGLVRGISKTFKGFFLAITIVLCTLLLLGATFNMVRETSTFVNMEAKISTKAQGWGESFTSPIHIADEDPDNVYWYIERQGDSGIERVKVEDCEKGIKGWFCGKLAKSFINQDNEGSSLAGIAAGMLTSLIVAVILFVGYCVGFGLICALIRAVTRGMHNSESRAVVILDRILGGLIGAGLALIAILVVFAILKSINKPSINDFMNGSTVCKVFFNSNPISKVFERIFGA